MLKRPTDELMGKLLKANHIDEYIKENENIFLNGTVAKALQALLSYKSLTKADVIHKAEMNDIYAYQIFAGKRIPSRDKLLCICFGMELTLDETQQLLKFAGCAPLYPKNKRDAILIFSIVHGNTVVQANEALYEEGERIL
ncbi:XRE family transcriptional regulator [Christensenellaceae bacterium NSJ-63]|uniref:XRE family transcriptional regulator n=2 Tax=Guopingia tenuis TaxID=2763656 RepID=A0A926DJ85_9FIRM|nr:XRE family transcriptional regulator [Guopingia tenuis]